MENKQLTRTILGFIGILMVILKGFAVIPLNFKVDSFSYILIAVSISLLYFKELKELCGRLEETVKRIVSLKVGGFEIVIAEADRKLEQEKFGFNEKYITKRDVLISLEQIEKQLRYLMMKYELANIIPYPASPRKIADCLYAKEMLSDGVFMALNSLLNIGNKIVNEGSTVSLSMAFILSKKILRELEKLAIGNDIGRSPVGNSNSK